MICPKCGTEIPSDAKVCYKCKAIQPNAKQCQYCGKVIDKRCTVCPKCGKRIPQVQNLQPQRQQPQATVRETKKPIYAKWWAWAIVAFFAIGVIGSAIKSIADNGTAENSVEPSKNQEEVTAEPSNSPGQTTEIGEYALDLDTVVAILRISLASNFGEDNYELEYDDTGMTVNIWGDDVALGATVAIAGDKEAKDAWDFLVESEKTLCNNILGQIEDAGIENYYVVVNVLNDMDRSKTLLSVLNGVVIYDAVND